MPTYSFMLTKTSLREAEVDIEAANFQEACQQLAKWSQTGEISWIGSADMCGEETIVRAIVRDGEAVPGVVDPFQGAPGWYGLNGIFDAEDLPPEFQKIED